MTDLAHTGSVARAGPPGVIEPIRRSGSRNAALARQPGLAESAADDQLRAADVALYMAKRAGRDRVGGA